MSVSAHAIQYLPTLPARVVEDIDLGRASDLAQWLLTATPLQMDQALIEGRRVLPHRQAQVNQILLAAMTPGWADLIQAVENNDHFKLAQLGPIGDKHELSKALCTALATGKEEAALLLWRHAGDHDLASRLNAALTHQVSLSPAIRLRAFDEAAPAPRWNALSQASMAAIVLEDRAFLQGRWERWSKDLVDHPHPGRPSATAPFESAFVQANALQKTNTVQWMMDVMGIDPEPLRRQLENPEPLRRQLENLGQRGGSDISQSAWRRLDHLACLLTPDRRARWLLEIESAPKNLPLAIAKGQADVRSARALVLPELPTRKGRRVRS
jgi:hypothetical protein